MLFPRPLTNHSQGLPLFMIYILAYMFCGFPGLMLAFYIANNPDLFYPGGNQNRIPSSAPRHEREPIVEDPAIEQERAEKLARENAEIKKVLLVTAILITAGLILAHLA